MFRWALSLLSVCYFEDSIGICLLLQNTWALFQDKTKHVIKWGSYPLVSFMSWNFRKEIAMPSIACLNYEAVMIFEQIVYRHVIERAYRIVFGLEDQKGNGNTWNKPITNHVNSLLLPRNISVERMSRVVSKNLWPD